MSGPKVILQTRRQLLRESTPDDAPAMFAMQADPAVRRYVPDPPFASIAEAHAFLAAYQDVYRSEGMGRWSAVDVETGEVLGWCGLRRQPGGEIDLGYRYRRTAWGRGLATEAAAACVELAFGALALEVLVARTHPDNRASVRVLEKLGFCLEEVATQGQYSELRYRLGATAWRAAQPATLHVEETRDARD
jgi:[ribosomal protein S5]-alanine N-acetyltransferase